MTTSTRQRLSEWNKRRKELLEKEKQKELEWSLSSDNILTERAAHLARLSGKDSDLRKKWQDLYKKAINYYNNEGYKTFADKYNSTINTEGYVNSRDTNKWYRELEELSKKDNEGIEELLAELDQYSRYYNEDAVKYVRDLISEKQKAYSDVMTDAGKFRDQWAKWATEDDYNNAVWESDFASKLEAGDVTGASQMYQDKYSQNPPAEGDTKASEYMDYINAARYNGWVDKYKNMSADELLAAKEQLSREFTGNAFNRDPMGNFNTQNAERGLELEYVDYLYQVALDNKKKQEYAAYDVDAGQAEIDYLQGFATRANEIQTQLEQVAGEINRRKAKGQRTDDLESQKKKLLFDLYQVSEEYRGATTDTVLQNHNKLTGQNGGGLPDFSDLVDFDALLSQAEADHTTAMRYRDNSLMSLEPLDDPEFNSKSQYIPAGQAEESDLDPNSWIAKASGIYTGKENMMKLGYADPLHEYINGDETVKASIEDAYLADAAAQGRDHLFEDTYGKYAEMTEDQIALYNYYYNTEGAEAAKKYLNSIDEELKTSKGFSNYEKYYKDSPALLKMLYSIPAGLDQFKSGVTGIFADGYTPASPTQVTGQLIREDLADESIPIWYNFKEGEWEDKVFGSSLGQMGYDFGSTTANMLPSILASTAVNAVAPGAGAVVGAGLLGASAGGNAKTEMLNLGYSKDQAEAYGLLVGAAEGGMEYLLGGISSLGGKLPKRALEKFLTKIDNALARVAINVGREMLSEGFEEGLQTVIEPWLKEAATNVDWEDPSTDEVLYSSLLGALSSLGMSAPGTVANGIGTAINNRQDRIAEGSKYAADPQALIDESLALDPNNKLAQKLQGKLEAGKAPATSKLGKLALQNVNAAESAMVEQDKAREQADKEKEIKDLNVQKRLSGKIHDKEALSKIAQTVTKALMGEQVSNAELRKVAENQAALTLVGKELGLEGLKVGTTTVSDLRSALAQKQSPKARLSTQNVISGFAAFFNMDEAAERSLMVNYAADVKNAQDGKTINPEDYAATYGVVYAAGKKGTDISKISGDAAKVLSKTAIAQAYRAGQMEAKNNATVAETTTVSENVSDSALVAQSPAKSTQSYVASEGTAAIPSESAREFKGAVTGKTYSAEAATLLSAAKIGALDSNKSYYTLDSLGIPKAEQKAWIDSGIAQARNVRGETVATVNTTVLKDEVKRREIFSQNTLQVSGQVDVQGASKRNTEGDSSKQGGLQGVSEEITSDAADVQKTKKENAIEPERVVYSSKTAKAYDAIPGNKLTKEQKKVTDVAAQIGRKVIFAVTTNANGVEVDGFIAKNGDIYINPNKNVSPMAFVLKHELAHFAQRAGRKYQDFKNAVRSSQTFKNWLKEKGLTERQYNEQIRAERASIGQKLDEPGATAEIISNFVGDMLFGDNNTISEDLVRELKPEQRKTVHDYIRSFFSWLKSKFVGDAGKAKMELWKLEKAFGAAYRAAVESSHANTSEEQFSIREVRGVSGASYGMGVYLDSTLLSDLNEEERIEMVKERIKELGGKSFTAHDSNGNAVEVHIVESKKKYKNAQGKKVPVNRHLTNYTKSKIKQEALVLADELIKTASHQSSDPANYPHDWLDNYGTNAWDKWTVFIQDKENTVWEATLQIANSANGDKILYEIHPIKMVEGAAKNSASSTISAEQSGKPNTSTTTNSISNSGEKNNSQNAQNFDEQTEQFSYTPQNEKIDDVFERIRSGELSLNDAEKLLKKPEADNPVTIANIKKEDMGSTPNVNKKTKGNVGDGDSRFAGSIQRSSIFNEEFKKEVSENSFVKHYAAITNKETLAEAAKRLDQGGEAYVTEWLSKKTVHMDTVDTVVGFILLKRYQDVGNYEGATAVAQKVRDVGTLSGQRVQAFSIIGRFDADMMQAYAQKELDKAWELAIQGRSDAWIEKHKEQFKLTDEDISFIRDNIMYAAKMPENSRERAIALAQITTLIQSKIPPTIAQSYKAWQRISMLLNPKTQIRNVLGNAMMAPVFIVSDWFSTPVDILISKATGTRTTGFTGVHGAKANLKAMGKGFAESYDDWKRHINTKAAEQNRFEIGSGKSFNEATKWGRIAKIMNGFDRFTSFLLDAGDRPFYEAWFMNSLNEQMRLNNVTEPTEAMVQIAVDEALSRTWQDENRMTKLVSGIKKAANQISIAGYGMGDVLIKFTKTPANLTKAIYDFSPAAIATIAPDAVRLGKAIKNGTATPSMQKRFVSNFGKMAAGTMLYVIFAALYAAGHIKGSSDEDKDVAAFEKYIQGIPEYSIKIGGKWFSYDWAQPIGAVPAIIADYMESREEGSGAIDSVINAFKAGGEVLFNQSFMTSFKTLFSAESFSEGLLDIILGEVTVPVPTVFSQLANVLDEKRRVTYDGTSEFKSALNRALIKIPGIRNMLEADIDVLGREVDNSQKSWFNAFFNPANVYTDTSTDVTDHAYEIYQSTGDVGAIPAKAPYSVKLQGKNIKLDDAQRAQYQKAMGESASDLIEILLENDVYRAMNDEEKLAVLKQVYSYSAAVAKDQLDWADDYEVISGIVPYITEKDFNAMSEEERYKIVSDYIFSDYEGMEDIDSDIGQSNFIINKKTANLVLSATLVGDIDKAVELIDGIESRVETYGWDEEDTAAEIKDRKTSVKTAVTRYWKEAYLYAYYKNDIEQQDKISDMLVKLGLYGDETEVEQRLSEWVEVYEEENE